MNKTNVMRILDARKISYLPHDYSKSKAVSAVDVAAALGEKPEKVFKTLVTVGKSQEHYVFVIPSMKELSLKKAAKASGEKNIEMIEQKKLLPLTGYIHGGCSPIGLKKPFPVFVDSSALLFQTICISGGKVGFQVELDPKALTDLVGAGFADLSE
jgi:Cys-tRNA(Pro)/Cys-tRNA(Cys) deacylase